MFNIRINIKLAFSTGSFAANIVESWLYEDHVVMTLICVALFFCVVVVVVVVHARAHMCTCAFAHVCMCIAM